MRRDLTRIARRSLGAVAELAATPLVPSDYLDTLAPLRAGSGRARIVELHDETASARTVVLRPAGRWPGHRAGQHVRLGVDVDGVRHWRSYSITSVAPGDGTIAVTVVAAPGGTVSTHLVRDSRVGDVVALEGPEGDFALPETLPGKALFVTAGSGITPVMGMLRTALADLPDVVVVHSARTADDVVFGRELRWWSRRGLLRLVERHTSSEGRLDATDLVQLVPDLAERHTWACGPNGLVDAVGDLFAERGWSRRLHVERFRPSVVAVGEGGTISFGRAGLAVEADGATSLLDAGEAAGVLLPSGCRMGICFGCVVPLSDGSVRDLRSGDVTTAAPGETVLVQTCINSAAGACRVDA